MSTASALKKENQNIQGGKNVEQEMSDQCCITRYQKNFTLAHSLHQVRTFLIFIVTELPQNELRKKSCDIKMFLKVSNV